MRYLSALAAAALVTIAGATLPAQQGAGWVSLFDGKTLDGWKVGENAASFSVADGAIVINGPRAHLYYVGPVGNHDFKNFEFKADVMTTPGSNSGIYFHTAYQEGGWPSKGYEVQVNNSHTDPKRTAGLYSVKDNMEAPAKDDEWFTMQIVVQGKHVTTSVNGKTIVDYTEPDGVERPADMKARLISSGTFALQGHDPKSKVLVKNIMVKVLPTDDSNDSGVVYRIRDQQHRLIVELRTVAARGFEDVPLERPRAGRPRGRRRSPSSGPGRTPVRRRRTTSVSPSVRITNRSPGACVERRRGVRVSSNIAIGSCVIVSSSTTAEPRRCRRIGACAATAKLERAVAPTAGRRRSRTSPGS